ncbi:phage recombination protein Bet [Klebsiella pneumoniae]|nr:phage recombination protein Bet [Klebsiella pneumoniae]
MANELVITASSLAERGIDGATWSALKNSIYPGAKDESVMMALDYCRARNLDPLLKPVHLVPMSVKDRSRVKASGVMWLCLASGFIGFRPIAPVITLAQKNQSSARTSL